MRWHWLIAGTIFSIACGLLVFMVASCASPVGKSLHLVGGVKEPVYPPDGPINCWIQPPHDDLWYPCPTPSAEDMIQQYHVH
jgi:hypothetical protein